MNTNPITPITRRNFLKTSAFATGSYLVLTRGTALASTASGSGAGTTTATCGRKWVTRIEVVFNDAYSHPAPIVDQDGNLVGNDDPGMNEWSGMVWRGTLRYWHRSCASSAEQGPVVASVTSGGYLLNSRLKPGSETPWPPGRFQISTAYSSPDKDTAGFNEYRDARIEDLSDPKYKYRMDMKIHFQVRKDGSSGCIVFTERDIFDGFVKIMKATGVSCSINGKCPRHDSVPLKVTYSTKYPPLPTYTWDRFKMGSPIPATDPTTTPPNP
jgi:hypothetical protein